MRTELEPVRRFTVERVADYAGILSGSVTVDEKLREDCRSILAGGT